MDNLNNLITDEDDDIADNLNNIENDDFDSSQYDWSLLDTLGEYEEKNHQLDTTIESLQAKIALYRFIREKSVMSKALAQEIDSTYGNLYNQRMIKESFTEEETQTNLKYTEIFMDGEINNIKDTSVQILKDLFDKGLDVVEKFYSFLSNDFQPDVLNFYNEVYTQIVNNEHLAKMESLLVLNEDKKFIDIFDYPLSEVAKYNFSDINQEIDTMRMIATFAKKMDDLLKEYPRFALLIKISTDNDQEVPLNTVVSSSLTYTEISIKDLFTFFRSRKGYFYLENVPSVADYIVNIVTFKRNDYREMVEPQKAGLLTDYILNVKDEVVEIQQALIFLREYIKAILPFIKNSKDMFVTLE